MTREAGYAWSSYSQEVQYDTGLGRAIGHEAGHTILGWGHSDNGLMRAGGQPTGELYNPMKAYSYNFTFGQGELIRQKLGCTKQGTQSPGRAPGSGGGGGGGWIGGGGGTNPWLGSGGGSDWVNQIPVGPLKEDVRWVIIY